MVSAPVNSGLDPARASTAPASVLVLGNYRQSLTVIRSLARAGYRIILGTAHERPFTQYSRYVSEIWKHAWIKDDEPLFVASLTDFVMARKDISWVYPVGEIELACPARHIETLSFRSRMVTPDANTVLTCLNKTRLYDITAELGMPRPEFQTVHDCSQLLSVAEGIGYPCVVKPNGSLTPFFGKKAIIGRTSADLRNSFGSWPERHDFLIVQTYVQGQRHNCHFAAVNGKLRSYFQWITVRTDRIDQTGIAVEGISVRPLPEMERYCEQLLTKLNYSGVGCIQFIVDETSGVIYFLELNPRLGATCAFAYHLGFDFPLMAMECVAGQEEIVPSTLNHPRTYPIGKRLHWLFGDVEGLVDGTKNGDLNALAGLGWSWRMTKAFARADAHVTWSWRDPLPTIVFYARLAAAAWGRFKLVLRSVVDHGRHK